MHQLVLEGEEGSESHKVASSFAGVIGQIIVIDLVFSLDSIITAVGMVSQVGVMIAAVVASVGMMMLFARSIGEFVSNHPTIKINSVLPGGCRRRVDCRRLRPPRAEGVHLLRDGFRLASKCSTSGCARRWSSRSICASLTCARKVSP